MYPEFIVAPAQREAFVKTRTGAIAGQRLVDRYGWKVGQKLPIASEIHTKADGSLNWEFDLVGMLDAEDPAVRGNTDMVLINVAYFDEARQFGRGKTGWYIVRIADSGQAKAIAAEIDRQFANSPDETKTQPEKEFAIGFAKQIGDIGALVTRILVAVFFTILILTGNTMAQSIRERIPELAMLKTLGFSDGMVTVLVLARPRCCCSSAAAAGMAAAVGLMPMLNGSTGGRFPPLFVERRDVAAAGAVVLGAGARRRAAARAACPPAAHRRRAGRASLSACCDQVAQITLINLRNVPHRLGTSLVVVIGIAGVVRRAGVRAGHGGGVPPHAGQHRAARPRDHAARRLRRRAVQRGGARPGRVAGQPARHRPRRRRAVRWPRPRWS